jgi:tripartite-type tricarboxylate transporter receptor subunit TctC
MFNKKGNRMRSFRSWLAAGLMVGHLAAAWAQTYPAQPVKVIFPFAPGTGSEAVLRVVADRLSDSLKQPVVIENRPGAGSTLGTEFGAKAPADGYTLIATFNSSIAPGPLMYNKLGYDPIKDFKHLALIGVFPQYMIVRADHPAKTVQDFIGMVRAKPGAINYSSAGVGTSGFLAGELLKQTLGLDMVHVPYKGPAPAITDLLGGRLDMVMTASAAQLVAAGKVRVLAVTSEKRVPSMPDVPALNEVAPNVQAVSWVGLSVPAQTPAPVVARLEKDLNTILNSPDMRARLSEPALGLTPNPLPADKFLEFIQKEMRTWAPVIKTGNIRIE